MKFNVLILAFLLSNFLPAQNAVNVLIDGLDDPIDITFVDNKAYAAIHGSVAGQGMIISFDPEETNPDYQILLSGLTYPRGIISRGHKLYIALTGKILQVDLAIDPHTATELPVEMEMFTFPRSMCFHGDLLYIAENEGLARIDFSKTNLKKELIVSTLPSRPLSITKEGSLLYMAVASSVFTFDLQSHEIKEVVANLDHKIYSLLIMNGYLYLDQGDLTYTEEKILVFDLSDLEEEPVIFCDELVSCIGLNEYNNTIYCAMPMRNYQGRGYSGKIAKIEKPVLSSTTSAATSHIKIFPNPTSSELKVDSSESFSDMIIYNSQGTRVKHFKNKFKLDLEGLLPGVYSIHVFNKMKLIHTEQVIKI